MTTDCCSDQFYKKFFDIAPIGLYTTKIEDGSFVRANAACLNMLGFQTLEEMQSKIKASDLCSKVQRDEMIRQVREHGSVEHFEAQFHLPNGEPLWVLISARVCDDGDCLVGSITDISDKKEMERRLEDYQRKEIAEMEILKNDIARKLEAMEAIATAALCKPSRNGKRRRKPAPSSAGTPDILQPPSASHLTSNDDSPE